MLPRIPSAALVAAAFAAGCASAPTPPAKGFATPRMHHLLDLEDARAPLRELEPFLRDADPEVRARAALAVGRKGGEDAAHLLRLAAKDPEARVRQAAWFGAAISGVTDLAGDALQAALKGAGEDAEKAAASSAAIRLGGERAWKEEAFAGLLDGKAPAVRRAALRTLVWMVREWKEKPDRASDFATRLLRALDLADLRPDEAVSAATLLRSLPPRAAPPGATGVAAQDLPPWGRLGESAERSPNADVRAACGQAFGVLEADVGRLDALLSKERIGRVRTALLRGLAKERSPAGTALLVRALRMDVEFGARATAAEMLGLRGEGARDAAGALAKAAAGDPSRLVRMSALAALHAVGKGVPQAEAAVLAASKDEEPFVRAAAAGALLPMEGLSALTRDPAIRVRESAVDEAGKRGRDALPMLLASVRDPDPVVAGTAASALGEMGASEAAGILEEVLRAHPVPTTFPDDWADLRAAAVDALGKLKADSARAVAEAHLADPDPSVRAKAADVLEGLDGKRPEMPLAARLLPFPAREELRVSDEGAPRVRFVTDHGTFVVQTLPAAAPVHVARFLARVRDGGYDGTIFHRVVPNFVIQGGDPRGDGSGSGGAPTREEFSPVPYERGVLGVPRSDHPDSGGCQLFFCHGSTPHLDERYTVTGRIVEGIEVIDAIDIGDRILRAEVLE